MKNIKKIGLVLFGSVVLSNASTTYTWTGTAADGDWDNADNWTSGNIASTTFISELNASPDVVRFQGSFAPTDTTFYVSTGTTSSTFSQVRFLFDDGGAYTIDYDNAFGSSPTYSASTALDIITVGDGVGSAAQVTVTLANYNSLLRHNDAGYSIVVNSDGVLQLDGVTSFGTFRSSNIDINGGSVIASSFVDANYGSTVGTNITFNDAGSSFTAAYGGQFVDFASVLADANSVFATESGVANFDYVDNGTSFTMTYIPEPTSVSLLGLGGLMLVTRRKR